MFVSIIITTLNRASALQRALESIARLSCRAVDLEILVVDNGSVDDTRLVCESVQAQYPHLTWRYFYDDMPGAMTGRHLGAREARGDIFAYIDDDVILAPEWLEGLVDAFGYPGVGLVGGPSLPQYEVKPPDWLDSLWQDFDGGRHCGYLSLVEQGPDVKPCDPTYVWGLNYAIRKEVFYACGGFHPDTMPKALQRYQGDFETGLSAKIRDKQIGALYHPAVAVTHAIPGSRLTPEAFAQRGYFQGVCDSFSSIRQSGNAPAPAAVVWKEKLKSRIKQTVLRWRAESAQTIRQLYGQGYASGFAWHQEEVRRDAKLLEWILKPDYLEYGLPEGWELYERAGREHNRTHAKR